jgi:hypothetical protein
MAAHRPLFAPAVLAALSAAVFASAPGAAAATKPAGCSPPALAQVFSWAQDTNWYAPLPGESWDSLGTKGWTLSGGAKIVSATLADGRKGTLLDLPSGAKATAPAACVTNDYPTARGEIRDVSGTLGVTVSVAYMGPQTWGPPQPAGTIKGVSNVWSLPVALSINPSNVSGWQLAQFTFTAAGSGSEYQLSNFYVDPRMH